MTFSVVDWSTLSEITSSKMRQMMDNDQYLKDQLSPIIAQTSLGSPFAVTNYSGAYEVMLTLVVTTQAGVFYRISAQNSGITTFGGSGIYLVGILRDGSNIVAESGGFCVANGGFQNGGAIFAVESPSAGSHTYTLAVKRFGSGTGTAEVEASKMYLMIEQMSQP